MGLSAKQIALVHIAANQLGLDDETRRDILEAHAGVRSTKALDYQGFREVMKHFEVSGFKAKGGRQEIQGKARPGFASPQMIRKIYALWWTLGGSYYEKGKELRSLRGFLRKRFRVEHENFLDFQTAHKAIEAIKAIGVRNAK